jgi:hypothetical protein
VLSWFTFTITFGVVRGIAYSIRDGHGPFHDVSAGGMHVHHYLWGIGLLAGIGGIAVRGEDETRRRPAVAISCGTGWRSSSMSSRCYWTWALRWPGQRSPALQLVSSIAATQPASHRSSLRRLPQAASAPSLRLCAPTEDSTA